MTTSRPDKLPPNSFVAHDMHNFLRRQLWVSLAVAQSLFLLNCAESSAQWNVPRYGYDAYHGYYPYGGGFGWGGGGTVAEGAGIGLGAAAQGLGQLEVSQGQYELEHTQAQSQYLQAYQQYLATLKVQRDALHSYQQDRAQEYQANTEAAKLRIQAYQKDMAKRAAPHRLSAAQFDRQHSVITWPGVLRDSIFDESRYEIDKLFAARTDDDSGAGSANNAAIEKATNQMLEVLKKDINNLDVDQFITGQHFISSLAYESRFAKNGGPTPLEAVADEKNKDAAAAQ
ncbi:hypothetical protein SH668x_002746 [Planctomicrobium sp. SH668]|uniref:hypothetical protein n=1 Tax=Planctomicrobium sp. SH668 TaxID=3448126 RepID=UPI003F5C38EF